MSTDPSPDVLDLAALRRNFADDMAFVARLLTKFEGRYPAQLQSVRDALARGDGTGAAEAAHRLAGETSVFYAVAARRAALAIEDLARAGDLTGAASACDGLARELGQLASALRLLGEG